MSAARPYPRPSGSRGPRRRVPLARVLALALILALPFAVDLQTATAYRGWCRTDPQFLIGGQLALVGVEVNVPNMHAARALSAGEPVGLVLTLPHGVAAEYLASDDGFGHGYAVTIERSPDLRVVGRVVPVIVAVYVPMTDPIVAVRVSFTPAEGNSAAEIAEAGESNDRAVLSPGSATGTVNTWIYLQT